MAAFPIIEIDATRCQTPFHCKKCLRICPQAVFRVSENKIEKGRETDPQEPGAYHLEALFLDKCSGCGDCVAICPLGALKIRVPEVNR
ncbi:MAG: 4Fe-4S dicluster domain-containing protein [Chloroflexota bacterium]